MDSSIKVFKQAWDWIKLIFGIAVGLLVLTGASVIWKASDFWSGVDNAKQSVIDTAKTSGDEIARSSLQSKQDISKALEAGKAAITTASSDAVRQSQALKNASRDATTGIEDYRFRVGNSETSSHAASRFTNHFSLSGLRWRR